MRSALRIVQNTAAVVLLSLLPMATPGQAQTTELTLRPSWLPYAPHIPFYLAQAKGWFQAENLKVNIEHSKGSVAAINLIGAGQGDIAFAALDAMSLARAKGLPVTAISSIFRKNEFGICFDKGKPFRQASDFVGKEVIFTSGSSEAPFIDTFLASGGVSRSSVKLVSVDAAAKYSSFVNGKGDAVGGSVPYCMATMPGKRDVDGLLFADFGMPMLAGGIIANENAMKAKPEALRAFNRVVAKSWAYILESDAHVTEGCQAMIDAKPQDRLSMADCKNVFEAFRPFLLSDATKGKPIGFQAPEDWDNTIKTLVKLKLVSSDAKATDFYTTQFEPKEWH